MTVGRRFFPFLPSIKVNYLGRCEEFAGKLICNNNVTAVVCIPSCLGSIGISGNKRYVTKKQISGIAYGTFINTV